MEVKGGGDANKLCLLTSVVRQVYQQALHGTVWVCRRGQLC